MLVSYYVILMVLLASPSKAAFLRNLGTNLVIFRIACFVILRTLAYVLYPNASPVPYLIYTRVDSSI